MRIAFLAFHCRYHYQALGAAFLEASLAERRPADACRLFQYPLTTPTETVLADLSAFHPDVLCSSGYLWSIGRLQDIALRVKRLWPSCFCLLGGPEAWLAEDEPGHFLLEPFDACLAGEGEELLPDVLDRLERGDTLPKSLRAAPITDLDALPSPFGRDFLRTDAPFLHLETSRGCSNHCTFCISGREPTRYYGLARVRDDMQTVLRRFPMLSRLNLLDRSLNENTERFLAVLELFLSLDDRRTLHFEFHPGFADETQLRFLEQAPAGRFHVEMGIQSLDAQVTALAGRRQDAAFAQDVARRLARSGNLDLHLDLLAGLPGQSLESLRHDVDRVGELFPDDIQLERLKLLPGTPMRKHADRQGLKFAPTPPWEILQTNLLPTSDLTTADHLSRLLDRYWNDAHLQGTLRALLRAGRTLTEVLDPLAALDDAREPLSVEARFVMLKTLCGKLNDEPAVWDQYWFDLCLLGLPRVPTPTSRNPEARPRLLRILKRLSPKGRGHLERFTFWPAPLRKAACGTEKTTETPPVENGGIDLLFLYLPGEVRVGRLLGTETAPQLQPMGRFAKGRLVTEQAVEEEDGWET